MLAVCWGLFGCLLFFGFCVLWCLLLFVLFIVWGVVLVGLLLVVGGLLFGVVVGFLVGGELFVVPALDHGEQGRQLEHGRLGG
ncbi:hypothetical protein RA279_27770, partial [Pseudomonas syringae pv. tagetis]|uniref:hypothetical protein n=1 Tax=Pseudomonas syringae group genomosp. 7 TaxID=251699 RepID=UPI00376F4E84